MELKVLVSIVLFIDSVVSTSDQPFDYNSQGTVVAKLGTSHGSYCTITNAIFDANSKQFVYKNYNSDHESCKGRLPTLWSVQNRVSISDLQCHKTYDVGHTYTVFFFYASSYYHLHTETLMPLYAATEWPKSSQMAERVWEKAMPFRTNEGQQIFMPVATVNNQNMKIDWNTTAFDKDDSFWVQMAQFPARNHTFLPLTENVAANGENICFKKLNIGMISYNNTNPSFIKAFGSYVKKELGIKPLPPFDQPVIGLIRRTNRRRILNEFELTKALNKVAKTVVLDFYYMDYYEQVRAMQQLSVLIGMNGAGLINAVYLPSYAVAVQLVPYKANVNWRFYGDMLRARGPYMEWHNKDKSRHRQNLELDPSNSNADTDIDIEEIVDLARSAIGMAEEHRMMVYRNEL
ncbi:hypothetical protein CAPTEDRAFT_225389 [Capitella teleta]|uniref:Glycosyltransferase 61 catalytic domain-containing protein n=1 Tax=Capitella teleta TaxID=283909 RepID=R7UBN2_CAPTE|nr:hypothetical protein CAPTEDRAFT_225389 [Capitella teleta]|eukprot:ELU00677.1 hypothetical protein CAPTEDRAFT_225389 [Capitella teleta]